MDDTNSTPYGCTLKKRTKLMMPKEQLLKENSPIKKEFDVPKINSPSCSSAINNNLLNVSILLVYVTHKFTKLIVFYYLIGEK